MYNSKGKYRLDSLIEACKMFKRLITIYRNSNLLRSYSVYLFQVKLPNRQGLSEVCNPFAAIK